MPEKKIFQIFNGFCHWETGYKSLEETKDFPPDCIFVEAPGYVHEGWGFDDTKEGDERFIHPEPPEGWAYDEDTNTFYPLDAVPRMLEDAQNHKQNENKMELANFLANHPLTWVDGKQYGVTMEDQSEIQLNMSQYMVAAQLASTLEESGDPTAESIVPVLQWHAIHEACTNWSYEELSALALAISQFVYPWFQKMNQYKAQIYACQDRKEVEKMKFVYKTDEELAAEEAEMQKDMQSDANNGTVENTENDKTGDGTNKDSAE